GVSIAPYLLGAWRPAPGVQAAAEYAQRSESRSVGEGPNCPVSACAFGARHEFGSTSPRVRFEMPPRPAYVSAPKKKKKLSRTAECPPVSARPAYNWQTPTRNRPTNPPCRAGAPHPYPASSFCRTETPKTPFWLPGNVRKLPAAHLPTW